MAGVNGLNEEARKDGGRPNDSLFAVRTVLPSLIVLFAVIAIGYLILDRLSTMDERMAGFDAGIEQLADQAERAVVAANSAREAADTALTRAAGAEQNAAEAARTREAALESRRVAEAMAAEAEEVARVATEEAGRARADLERLEQERQEELDRLQAALGAIVETRRTALGLVMNFGSDAIEFGFDSGGPGRWRPRVAESGCGNPAHLERVFCRRLRSYRRCGYGGVQFRPFQSGAPGPSGITWSKPASVRRSSLLWDTENRVPASKEQPLKPAP